MQSKDAKKIKTSRLEKSLTLYFLFLIIISSIDNLLKNNSYNNVWTIGEWLINYEGGFVRRGLFGSIIYKLSYGLQINPIVIVQIFSVLFFIFFLYLLKDTRKYFSILFLLSPLVSLAPFFENFFVRKDFSGVVAYALCTNLIIKKRHLTNFFLINFISCISILNHESYFFYGIPSLFLLHLFTSQQPISTHNNFFKICRSIIFLLPSLIATLLVFYFKGNYELAFKINQSWINLSSTIPIKQVYNPYFLSGAIGSLSWTFNKAISLPLYELKRFVGGGLIWNPAIWLLTVFICAQIFIGDKQKLNAKLKLKVLLLQLTFISPLFLLGWDFGRWIFLWMSSSVFLTVALIKIQKMNINNFDQISIIFPNFLIRLFNGYELNGFKKCLYLFLSIPACCWSLNSFLKLLPIVYPFRIF